MPRSGCHIEFADSRLNFGDRHRILKPYYRPTGNLRIFLDSTKRVALAEAPTVEAPKAPRINGAVSDAVRRGEGNGDREGIPLPGLWSNFNNFLFVSECIC